MLLKFLIFCFVFVMIVRIISRVVSFTLTSSSTKGSFNQQQRTHRQYQNRGQSHQHKRTDTRSPKDNLDNIEEADFEDITDEES